MIKTGYAKALDNILKNKANAEAGKINSIPFGFDRFEEFVPGIMQEVMYQIIANSGVGKTQLAKKLFLQSPINFILDNPNCGIKLKIFYFALEESEEEFFINLIANRLKIEYNISVDINDLLSRRKKALPNNVLEKIKESEEYFDKIKEYLEIIDCVSNPFGIFKHVREYARSHGKFTFKGEIVDPTLKDQKFDKYIPDNPDEYVIVIVDHIGLLTPEGNNTLHETMTKWTAEYCRKQLSKHYKYICVNVQQLAAEGEKKQYTMRGESIIQKLIPSADNLGENKTTVRDHHILLGLFAPDRHEIEDFDGYNIGLMKDNFRSLVIRKNRIGTPNKRVGLYFDGASNIFKELPKPENMTEEIYKKIINKTF